MRELEGANAQVWGMADLQMCAACHAALHNQPAIKRVGWCTTCQGEHQLDAALLSQLQNVVQRL